MIPVYSTVSFLSYIFYRHAIYYEVVRDCYEAFAIASFFTLLCHYIAPTLHDQKDYFRLLTPRNWILPVNWMQRVTGGENRGILRKPKSGLTWFNVIWVGIFQYCFIRVLMTAVSALTQAIGRYCEVSLSPAFAHLWVGLIQALAVTLAMYCVIQFYIQMKGDLSEYRPFLKVLCIKLVIFFSFWQNLIINFFATHGIIPTSDKFNFPDIKVGIPSMLICIEMALFALLHVFAFSWKPYSLSRHSDGVDVTTGPDFGDGKLGYLGGPLGVYALLDAFNPWDFVKATGRGFKWLFIGRRRRHEDLSYRPNGSEFGLEPTRNSAGAHGKPINVNPAYNGVQYSPSPSSGTAPSGKTGSGGRYHPLNGEEDADHLIAHAQPEPYAGSRPRVADQKRIDSTGDLGRMGGASGEDRFMASNPAPDTGRRMELHDDGGGGGGGGSAMGGRYEDTGYHGARF
ncbi:MAG: hypothetical protein M1835_002654 [Candelina submexicana]|nr:MAG: hypothetical protein M1835_002654 [Candelina submexicana]